MEQSTSNAVIDYVPIAKTKAEQYTVSKNPYDEKRNTIEYYMKDSICIRCALDILFFIALMRLMSIN